MLTLEALCKAAGCSSITVGSSAAAGLSRQFLWSCKTSNSSWSLLTAYISEDSSHITLLSDVMCLISPPSSRKPLTEHVGTSADHFKYGDLHKHQTVAFHLSWWSLTQRLTWGWTEADKPQRLDICSARRCPWGPRCDWPSFSLSHAVFPLPIFTVCCPTTSNPQHRCCSPSLVNLHGMNETN